MPKRAVLRVKALKCLGLKPIGWVSNDTFVVQYGETLVPRTSKDLAYGHLRSADNELGLAGRHKLSHHGIARYLASDEQPARGLGIREQQ